MSIIINIIFISYSYLSIRVMKNNYVSLFGYTFFEVASGSMSPAIKTGDIVVVKLNSLYHEGDIVTYEDNSSYITHRIVRIDGDRVLLKGDANNVDDAIVSSNVILGKVVLILKSIYLFRRIVLNVRVVVSFFITIVLFGLVFSYKNIDKLKKFRMRKIHYRREKKSRRRVSIKKRDANKRKINRGKRV